MRDEMPSTGDLWREKRHARASRLAAADCVDLGAQVIRGIKPDGFETSRQPRVLDSAAHDLPGPSPHSPRFPLFIARSTSRLASRVLMDSRRSCCFFPLANPSSTLARPRLEK